MISLSDTRIAPTALRLFDYLRPNIRELGIGIFCFFLSAAIEPLLPALLKQLLDHGFRSDVAFPLWLAPITVVGIFAARGFFAFAGTYLLNRATSSTVLEMRMDLMRALLHADASLYSQASPGVLASRIINDPQSATGSLAGAITTILRDGTSLIALFAYLLYVNWKLTLISLITFPLLAFVVRAVQRRVLTVGGRSWETQVRLVGIVDDVARAWRVVRTFNAEEFERSRFESEARKLRQMTLKGIAAGASMTPLTQVVASLGVAVILTLALWESQRLSSSVGEFVAFITALLMTISPMRHLTDVVQPILGGLLGARACFDLIDTPPETDRGTRDIASNLCQGEIGFHKVSVAYPGSEHKALNGLDLQIPAGKTVALVGPSGSGKTTIVNAMLGFVAPTEGRITLDGIDVTEIRKASLRRQFAVVSQDIVLFDGPLADNVAYAAPKDMARIEACLKAANLWDFVQSQPEGLNMTIGTNGSRLSGGQRQRLAIARALYKQARIWVFDEATSALDSESERIVQQSIEQWHGEKTLILIAHRLSTVRNADCIYVMSDGRVVESGTHKELMERGGLYAGMVAAQAME